MGEKPVGTMGVLTLGPVIVKQRRHTQVCGLVALANYLNFPYEDVYVLGCKVSPKGVKFGFLLRELAEVAAKLGRPMQAVHWSKVRQQLLYGGTAEGDASDFSGVVGVNWATTKGKTGTREGGHWVFVRNGTLIDPDDDPPRLWDPDDYLTTFKGTFGWALIEK
jgi:hypothetical protein